MTLLSLDAFRREFNYHPWHFWQLADTVRYPVNLDCQDVVYQYAWQAVDAAARDNIKTAINAAEDRLREYLRYSIAPHYVTETLPITRWFDSRLDRLQYTDASGRWLNIQLKETRLRAIGAETRAFLGNVALVFSDTDGDGLNDTFTATLATTITDPSQIEVQFAAGDRWDGSTAGEDWRIAPVSVTISGGMATLRGRIWLLVRPVLYESGAIIDPTNPANFVTTLDVYRHYCDPDGTTLDTAQAVLIWETRPWPWWAQCYGCGGLPATTLNSADPASYGYALARVNLRDAARGLVGVGEAIYNADTGEWQSQIMSNCRPPSRILIRYQAGDDPGPDGQLAAGWRTIAARLAAAELGKRVCACESANRLIYEQQIDHAFTGDARTEKFNLSSSDYASLFGYKAGQLYAWRNVRNLRDLVGVLA